jgi:hypothetical protein
MFNHLNLREPVGLYNYLIFDPNKISKEELSDILTEDMYQAIYIYNRS